MLLNNSYKVIEEYEDAWRGSTNTFTRIVKVKVLFYCLLSFDVSVWKQVRPLVALNNVVSSGARRAAHSKQIEQADGFNFRDLSSP